MGTGDLNGSLVLVESELEATPEPPKLFCKVTSQRVLDWWELSFLFQTWWFPAIPKSFLAF